MAFNLEEYPGYNRSGKITLNGTTLCELCALDWHREPAEVEK